MRCAVTVTDQLPSGHLSLRDSVAWGMAGTVAYALCQWLLLLVLARLGSLDIVGQYSLGLAMTAPVFMFTNLQLASLEATDAAEVYTFSDYRLLRLLSFVVAGAVICAVAFQRPNGEARMIILLVGLSKLVEACSDVHYGLFQRQHRLDLVARSQFLRGTGAVICFWLALRFWGGLASAVVAMTGAWSLVLLLHDRPTQRRHKEWNRPRAPGAPGMAIRMPALVREALPLGVVAMLISLNVSLPRVFTERYLGAHALGVFTAMAYFIVAGRLVIMPLGQAVAPRLGLAISGGQRGVFLSLLRLLVGAGAAMGVAGVVAASLAGPLILSFLYGHQFATQSGAFVILMAAAGFGYVATFLQVAATAARSLTPQVSVIIATLFATCAGSLLLVPTLGVSGAALAVLAGAVVECLGSGLMILFVVRRLSEEVPPTRAAF